jgi:predicted DNA-binding protein (MmcQ/YjbR family)
MTHDDIRKFCLALPGATADIKWKVDETFLIGGKMFCVMCIDPAQSEGVSLKADPERFLELTDQPGVFPSPYLARYHWIRLERPAVLPTEVLEELLRTAYQLVRAKLPKKTRDSLPVA